MKHRLTGAAILIGFAVIILPMLLGGPDNGGEAQNDDGAQGDSGNHVFQSKIQPIGGEVPEDRTVSSGDDDAARPDSPPPSSDDEETRPVVTAVEEETTDEVEQPATSAEPDEEPEPTVSGGDDETVERGWIVQIGTFKNPANVEKLVAKLQSGGFGPSTTEVKTDEGAATRVWVGPYGTRVEAARNKTRVKQSTGTEGLIVAYP